MSQLLTLACPPACSISDFCRALLPKWSKYFSESWADNGIQLNSWMGERIDAWYVDISEFEDQEEAAEEYFMSVFAERAFKEVAIDMRYYIVEFNDFDVINEILLDLFEKMKRWMEEIWIDDGYEGIARAKPFYEKLKGCPDWDWRMTRSWFMVLACPQELATVNLYSFLKRKWCDSLTSAEDGEYQLLGPNGVWRIMVTDLDQRKIEDPIMLELLNERFSEISKELRYYIVQYDDLDVAKSIAAEFLEDSRPWAAEIWADDGYGNVMPAVEFIEKIRRDPAWDWRKR